jgi:hypothetical protein
MPFSRVLLALVASPRVLLAVKSALAAALAWWVAPHVPGVAADYPYYAPLGALVTMYSTVAASLRQGLQTLLGLVVGIGLAALVVGLGHTSVLTVALVIGVGVLLAGLPFLGAGRDWVPMAGLFVLLIGGADSESYSLGYVVQMLVGIVIGLAVNLVVVPPLHTGAARRRLDSLREALADRADDLAGVLDAPWPLADHEWERSMEALPATQARVRATVDLADDSRRLNPRRVVLGRLEPGRLAAPDRAALEASERISFHLRDAAEVIGGLARRQGRADDQDPRPTASDSLTPPLHRLFAATAVALRAPDDERAEALAAARAAEGAAWRAVDDAPATSARATSGIVSALVSAGRILVALDGPPTDAATRPGRSAVPRRQPA